MSDQVAAHVITRTITERVIDPSHARRKESPAFQASKRRLKADGHYRCWVCGATAHLQVHHFGCEWALWPDADPEKVKAFVEAFDPYGYGKLLRNQPITSPDDVRCLLVLCRAHHIERGTGVHELTMPTWTVQAVSKPGQDPVPQEEHHG